MSLFSNRPALFIMLVITMSCLLPVASNAQETYQPEALPEEIYKEIIQGCMKTMSTKVVQPQVSKAYCYCYAERLSLWMTEADFDRMAAYGATEHDQETFKKARHQCKPPRQRKAGFFDRFFSSSDE